MCLKMEDHRGHGLIGPADAVSMLHSMTDKLLKDAQTQAEKLTFAMSHCDGVRVVPRVTPDSRIAPSHLLQLFT